MNHAMRLSMFNNYCKLKLLSVANTRFASTIVMFKRLKTINRGLEQRNSLSLSLSGSVRTRETATGLL